MQRILVVGMSGAGKTTAARQIADRLALPLHEMDALALGPGWSTPPDFHDRIDALCADPRWVLDSWGYPVVRDQLWAAADTVVWLDYRRTVVLPRLVRRSALRTLRRERIFGGNRETLAGWFRHDHPVWHALGTFTARRHEISERTGAAGARLSTVRLASPHAFNAWVVALRADPAGAR